MKWLLRGKGLRNGLRNLRGRTLERRSKGLGYRLGDGRDVQWLLRGEGLRNGLRNLGGPTLERGSEGLRNGLRNLGGPTLERWSKGLRNRFGDGRGVRR